MTHPITGTIPHELTLNGTVTDCTIHYRIIPGRPATYGQPEEFAHAEVTDVETDGVDLPVWWEPDDALLERCMADAWARAGEE